MLFHFSPFIYDSFFSLFLFLLSFSASLHLLSSPLFLSFFFSSSFFLQNLHLSLFLAFFSPFFFSVTFSAPSLSFFFPYHSTSLSFFFPPPRPLPLRSAITVEFGLAVEFSLANKVVAVEISDSDLPLFFFLRLWIPCDCDYG